MGPGWDCGLGVLEVLRLQAGVVAGPEGLGHQVCCQGFEWVHAWGPGPCTGAFGRSLERQASSPGLFHSPVVFFSFFLLVLSKMAPQ